MRSAFRVPESIVEEGARHLFQSSRRAWLRMAVIVAPSPPSHPLETIVDASRGPLHESPFGIIRFVQVAHHGASSRLGSRARPLRSVCTRM